jgi:hypothetical protein
MMLPSLRQLALAAEGLYYQSEGDEPLHTFLLPEGRLPEKEDLLFYFQLPPDTAFGETTVEQFFRSQKFLYPGAAAPLAERAARFGALEALLLQLLQQPAVYRLGKTSLTACVVGQLPEGGYGGIYTNLIET